MRVSSFFVLASFLVAIVPATAADNAAMPTSGFPAAPLAMSTPSASGQSALERALNPAPTAASDNIAEQLERARENVQVPENIHQAFIQVEERRLASLQKKMITLQASKESSGNAQDQKVGTGSPIASADADPKIEEIDTQIKKSQQRLDLLRSGPLTAKNFEAYKQMMY